MGYFTKICWNQKKWTKPSGLDGKSDTGYERESGYGHEEWLLDTSKLIDGYHYSHLQSVSKRKDDSRNELENFDITLFSRENSNPPKLWQIGVIREVEAITIKKSEEIFNKYNEKGWIDEMRTQLLDVNADIDKFELQMKNAGGFVCIRFKPENLDLDIKLVDDQDFINNFFKRYKHYNLHKLDDLGNYQQNSYINKIPFKGGHTPRNPGTRNSQSYEQQKEVNCVHIEIQDKIYDILKEDYKIETERKVETGGYVDLSIEIDKDCEIFYEIKTSNTVKECIREAFGQLMEYTHYPINDEVYKRAVGLVIVSQNAINDDAQSYINKLREFKINIYYQQFNLETNTLVDAYPTNPLKIECN